MWDIHIGMGAIRCAQGGGEQALAALCKDVRHGEPMPDRDTPDR